MNDTNQKIEPLITSVTIGAVAIFSVAIAIDPKTSYDYLNGWLNWSLQSLSWLYILCGVGAFSFMCWLAFGPVGRVKLGDAEEKPEFTKTSWIFMLFCAGIGISICNWAFVEPLYFIESPPLGITPKTHEAIEWAAMYPIFHWTLIPWSIYLLPSVPIAYALYVRKDSLLRMSSGCRGILGKHCDGLPGKIIDIISSLALVGGISTSFVLSIPLVARLFQKLFGLEITFGLQLLILAIWVALIGWSVYGGLKKGIKVLSDVNAVLAIIFLLFILLAGSTQFTLKIGLNSVGLFLDNFFRISFWTDPVDKGGFVESWTAFYWAWWIVYAPLVGLFMARISRGRTVRELIVNGVLWSSIGCAVFFIVFGARAIDLSLDPNLDLLAILNNQGIPETIVTVLTATPGSWILVPTFTVLCFVFLATTLDSSAFVIAGLCTKGVSGYDQPIRSIRVIWVLLLGLYGVALLKMGGAKTFQILTVLMALPMIPIMIFLVLSMARWATTHSITKKTLNI